MVDNTRPTRPQPLPKASLLQKPDYIEYDDDGSIKVIYCKVCGTVIAQWTIKDRGETVIIDGKARDVVKEKFTRLPNYAELKMQMVDGRAHVTNGCIDDIQRAAVSLELMQAMYEADIPYAMPGDKFNKATVKNLSSLALHSKGLL